MTVNVKEGMRRLALATGVLGAGIGALGAYVGFGDIAEQRARFGEFESLVRSNRVKEVRSAFWSYAFPNAQTGSDQNSSEPTEQVPETDTISSEKPNSVPGSPQGVRVRGPDGKNYLFPAGTTKDKAVSYFKRKGITGTPGQAPGAPTATTAPPPPDRPGPWVKYRNFRPVPGTTTVVNKDGIKSITWADKDFSILKIETLDGRVVWSRHAPPVWLYLLTASYPLFGFLVPWGAIRGLGWVAVGFQGPGVKKPDVVG